MQPLPRRLQTPLRLLARADSDFQPELAHAIAEQLDRAKISTELVLPSGESLSRALESGAFDLRIETTWGVPYDPDISLHFRFGPQLDHPASDDPPAWGQDAEITKWVMESQREWDEDRRALIHARNQERIDQIALIVPLYAPRRLAVVRADRPLPRLDHDLDRIDAASVAPASFVRQP
jgi:ABC-type transport system substrate-binding protein